jgi:hypothetical protein
MLPRTSQIVNCSHCRYTGWRTDFLEVDRCLDGAQRIFLQIELLEGESQSATYQTEMRKFEKYAGLPHLEEAEADDISRLLNTQNLRKKDEIVARFLLWHKLNHVRRWSPSPPRLVQHEVANLEKLRELLREEVNSPCFLQAEVARQLGLFKEAESLLSLVPESDQNQGYRTAIMQAAVNQDCHLKPVY